MLYGSTEFAQFIKDAITQTQRRHPLYQETVEHAEAMSVHIYGTKPEALISRVRPREEDDVKAYRIENYEPITKAGADKAIDIVSKIFNTSLYSIIWKEKNSQTEEFEKYTMEYYPEYNSIMTFNKDVTLRKMLADPNGIIAIRLPEITADQSQRPQPEIVIFGSANIWNFDRDHYLIYLRDERRGQIDYYYFEYYDKTQWIEFEAWYDASAKQIEITPMKVYPHKFGEIPAWKLRGKSKSNDNGTIVYESIFSAALPHWNLAVIHESDLLGAFIDHLHPQKYEVVDECNYTWTFNGDSAQCNHGKISYTNAAGKKETHDCPSCYGTGFKAVKSPYGAYQFSKKKLEDGDQPAGLLPVGYINIPVEATKMLKEHCKDMNMAALAAINMDVENKVGEVQSGVAKAIDRSAQRDTIYNIACVMFDVHVQNQFYFINKYMFGVEAASTGKEDIKNLPEVNKPTKFDILTTSELMTNYEVSKKAGLDKNFLRIKTIEIISSDLSTMPDMKNYLIAQVNLDPLFGYDVNEISTGVNQGVIRKVDWAIHENLKPLIDKAITEHKDFLQMEKKDQIAILEGYAQEIVDGEQMRLDEAQKKLEKSLEFAA